MRERGAFIVEGWGLVQAVWQEDKLLLLQLTEQAASLPLAPFSPFFAEVALQVRAYLQGRLRLLDIPHLLPEQPSFRYRLWRETQNIPYGTVLSYGGLAARAGNPRAPRAAGSAMSLNPLFLLVPCHRVIAAGNRLGGYGNRPELKIRLLRLEGFPADELLYL